MASAFSEMYNKNSKMADGRTAQKSSTLQPYISLCERYDSNLRTPPLNRREASTFNEISHPPCGIVESNHRTVVSIETSPYL